LNVFGKNRLLATSYLWLIVVPVTAKVFSKIENPLDLSNVIDGLVIDLELPFSWHLFYYSAVLISLGGAIYRIRCPAIIRDYSTFADYARVGRGSTYLLRYYEKIDGFEFEKNASSFIRDNEVSLVDDDHFSKFAFWDIYGHENYTRYAWRLLCFTLYTAGLALILVVLAENFFYVVSQA